MIFNDRLKVDLIRWLALLVLSSGMTGVANAEQANQVQLKQSTGRIYGKVIQTVDASGYTYAQVDTGKEKVWAASRKTVLNKGDMIAFSTAMPMKNHYSKTLKRKFSVVYFSNQFITDKAPASAPHAGMSSPHANIEEQMGTAPVIGVDKVNGGYTIAEIYQKKQKLKGKTVKVRGKVTKFTANVMGKNWLHIMDSSTHSDLTVTTKQTANANDVIVIEGLLQLDKDYNYGYVYPVIVESAKILSNGISN